MNFADPDVISALKLVSVSKVNSFSGNLRIISAKKRAGKTIDPVSFTIISAFVFVFEI